MSDVRCRPLTPARWNDLVALFGPRGACGGCWCMWFRVPRAAFAAGKGEGNKRRLRSLLQRGVPLGVLAYRGRTPVGWCAVAPRTDYPQLARSRVLAPVDAQPVWSATCFFVAREARRQGVTRALLEGAAAFAARHGARMLEAYPVDARARQADAFVYHGIASTFEAAGWREVARRSPTRPIVRLALSPSRANGGADGRARRRAGAAG